MTTPRTGHVHRPDDRRQVGTCARADRPDAPAASMTVAVCRCGAELNAADLAAAPSRDDVRANAARFDVDEDALRDALRRRTGGY